MNASPDDLDAELLGHFRHHEGALPHDPFVGSTARRIGAARRRHNYARYALQAAGLVALVLGSRWLIDAAAFVSTRLDTWFGVGIDWLVTPLGTAIILAGLAAAGLAVFTWRGFRTGRRA